MASLTQTQMMARHLLKQNGLSDAGWTFAWDHARKRGGLCNHTHMVISMSKYLVPLWEDEPVRQILLHEIAHALAGPGNGHNHVWLSTARQLGYTGGRCHSQPTVQGGWVRVCPIHGQRGTRKWHRRTAVVCGSCQRQGVVTKIQYRAA